MVSMDGRYLALWRDTKINNALSIGLLHVAPQALIVSL